jgi:hypothetical protein
MLRSKVSLLIIAGAIAVSGPAFSQEENPAYKNEASVQTVGSFVKTTTSNGVDTMSVDPPAPGRALALYLASAAQGDTWSAPNGVMLEIDAYLPRLGEEGHLRAIRAWAENKTPEYQLIHLDGDASVKQQVIARYLNAEQEAAAMPACSFAITPANYKFRYVGSGSGTPVYVFHITPRKKRSGLINGELWIDGATGLVIHEAGYLVKRPSIFIRHFKMVRDVSVQDGAPYIRTTQIEIDARFVGRADLTITERPSTRERSKDIPNAGEQEMMCARAPLVSKAGSQSACAGAARIPLRNGPSFICWSRTISASAWAAERVSSEATNETYASMI